MPHGLLQISVPQYQWQLDSMCPIRAVFNHLVIYYVHQPSAIYPSDTHHKPYPTKGSRQKNLMVEVESN